MGLDYHIYKPKESLKLSNAIDLIQSSYANSIKTKYSEFFIEFSLLNTEKYVPIVEKFNLIENTFHLSNSDFNCNSLNYISIIGNSGLYNRLHITSEGYYGDNRFGYSLQIDNEKLDLIFNIGLPYRDLHHSKKLLSDLIRHLHSEGIYLGLSDYDNTEKYVEQLINQNSSNKPSYTWQLNISDFYYRHGNGYAPNSNFENKEDKTYRLTGIRVGFPEYYFKHKNISEDKKINNYTVSLLKALTKYFEEKTRMQFTSANYSLINRLQDESENRFKLSSTINLMEMSESITEQQLNNLFEIGYNQYTLSNIKLHEDHNFNCKLSIVKEKEDEIEFLLYTDYTINKEENYRTKIENSLKLALEYVGAE